jgi:hypothetical protein
MRPALPFLNRSNSDGSMDLARKGRPFRPLTLGQALLMDRGPAPQGLQNSAQGFNPGSPQNKRFALKGREMRVLDEAPTYWRAKVRLRNWDVRQLNHQTPLPPG